MLCKSVGLSTACSVGLTVDCSLLMNIDNILCHQCRLYTDCTVSFTVVCCQKDQQRILITCYVSKSRITVLAL